jgi:peptidoglycan-associated lipoprotein
MGSDSGSIAGLTTVHFDYDSATLRSDTKAELAKNAEWLKANPGTNIQIEGHCDSKGSNEYNLSLGERRASAVKAYMQTLGIEAGRMSTVSYGEEKLLSMGDTEADHAKNRRANFVPAK